MKGFVYLVESPYEYNQNINISIYRCCLTCCDGLIFGLFLDDPILCRCYFVCSLICLITLYSSRLGK